MREYRTDVFEWEWLELVTLQEIIQVLFQHLKHKTGMVLVSEALMSTDKVVVIRGFLS